MEIYFFSAIFLKNWNDSRATGFTVIYRGSSLPMKLKQASGKAVPVSVNTYWRMSVSGNIVLVWQSAESRTGGENREAVRIFSGVGQIRFSRFRRKYGDDSFTGNLPGAWFLYTECAGPSWKTLAGVPEMKVSRGMIRDGNERLPCDARFVANRRYQEKTFSYAGQQSGSSHFGKMEILFTVRKKSTVKDPA